MWQPLFANLAVAAIALVAWGTLGDHLAKLNQTGQRLLFGGAMALGTLGSMMMAFEVVPGIYFDLRSPLVAVSSFFGGPIAAVIVAGTAVAYRIYMGGAVAAGVISIILSAGLGLVCYAICRARLPQRSDLMMLASTVAALIPLVVLTLPSTVRDTMLPLLWAPISLSFISTLLLGLIILHEHRQRELAVSNMLYRSMVDILPDCLNIKDLEGRFLAANPATAVLMKAGSAEALIGKTDFDFYPADEAAKFREDELVVLARGQNMSIEQSKLRNDGTVGWLSTLKVPIRSEDGTVTGLITHNRDVTVSKELQQKLEQTQIYLDQALDNMNDGLAMFDPSGVIVFCNDRYRELFPMTAHLRVSGAHFADIIRYSVACGEESLTKGESLEAHVARKLRSLREPGENLIEVAGGKTFASRTKILGNGYSLRMIADVTERQMFERNLEYQAQHDPLTGLANRSLFNRVLNSSIEAAREDQSAFVVMLLDLDRFKQVNDNFGHAAGDALLVEVSRRLEKSMRADDLVARLGGDEFAIVIKNLPDETAEIAVATKVIKSMEKPFRIGDVTLIPGASIGYTAFPRDNTDADGLLRNADSALYRAKARGRGTWKVFDPREELKALPVRA